MIEPRLFRLMQSKLTMQLTTAVVCYKYFHGDVAEARQGNRDVNRAAWPRGPFSRMGSINDPLISRTSG